MVSSLFVSLPLSFPGSEGWELQLPIQTPGTRRELSHQPPSLPSSLPTFSSPPLFSQSQFCLEPRALILKLGRVKLKCQSYKLAGYPGEFWIWFEGVVRFPRALEF